MTPEEITALAREYAERYRDSGFSAPITEEAKQIIRFMLRRFCIVEKSKLESTYNRIWNEWNFTLDAENKANSKFLLSALESLFPEIAKEVES